MSHHDEFEHKYEAEDVLPEIFMQVCMERSPERYLRAVGPDAYYEQGDNVLRHRLSGGAGELTVKRRKSELDSEDRLEIDLHFDPKTSVVDVQRFLQATGWARTFTVLKDCRIFWFREGAMEVNVSYYESWLLQDDPEPTRKRFVEIEIEKGTKYNPTDARAFLLYWRNHLLRNGVALGDRINESLYELYSGKKYGIVND